jgi:hypothetical protein
MYPSATLTVYATAQAGGGLKVAACYAAKSTALANYYAGSLRVRWEVQLPAGEEGSASVGGQAASVSGQGSAHVHYFEDGNCQFTLHTPWAHTLDGANRPTDVAAALLAHVRGSEAQWHERLVDCFLQLGDGGVKVRGRHGTGQRGSKAPWQRGTAALPRAWAWRSSATRAPHVSVARAVGWCVGLD